MSEREEVLLEPGFVLHARPYRNSSLIVECLTGQYGRQTLVAQGARRAESRQRSALQPFGPVSLSWVRRGELGRLTRVESGVGMYRLTGAALLAGFYLNELLLRLVPRGDPNAAIMSCYSSCLDRLSGSLDAARAVRLFEFGLLDALGVGIDLERDCHSGEPIDPGRDYYFEHEGGFTASSANSTMTRYSGKHLISLREHELSDAGSLRAAKRLLGAVLKFHLGDRPLKSRAVAREIVDRGLAG